MTVAQTQLVGADASVWLGTQALDQWRTARPDGQVDVVLLTHPRDEADLPRMLPWTGKLTAAERRELLSLCGPRFGEVIEADGLTAGVLFLPMLAADLIDPVRRRRGRSMIEAEGLALAAAARARVICLGGLTGALTGYGRRLVPGTAALGIEVTTGHAVTAVSILFQYQKVLAALNLADAAPRLALLGAGSVGGAFARLLLRRGPHPRALTLVDTPGRRAGVEALAQQLRRLAPGCEIKTEFANLRGELDRASACYQTDVLVSAVSTPYVIDVGQVRPGTVLIDDSQPYCWSRPAALARLHDRADILPCDAGLVDCRSLNFRSHFPFDFADHGEHGSTVAWSCMTEGLLRAWQPSLPATIGEPDDAVMDAYADAFESAGLRVAELQCGAELIDVDRVGGAIRAHWTA